MSSAITYDDSLYYTAAELASAKEFLAGQMLLDGIKPKFLSGADWFSLKMRQPGYKKLRDLWTSTQRKVIGNGYPRNDAEIWDNECWISRVEKAITQQTA